MAKIRIESKLTGEIIESTLRNWKQVLNLTKWNLNYEGLDYPMKSSVFINYIGKFGKYEDDAIKAYIIR